MIGRTPTTRPGALSGRCLASGSSRMRRADPERIYQAKRAGFLARIADRIGHERAERLIAALERETASLGLQRESAESPGSAPATFVAGSSSSHRRTVSRVTPRRRASGPYYPAR